MVGKRVRDALYIHREAIALLDPTRLAMLDRAASAAPDCVWNVARLEPGVVGLLLYEAFDVAAFPALLASTRITLETGAIAQRSFANAANPLILHRKELLVAPDDPRVAAWARLTGDLQARGLFRDPHLIGRRDAWERRLADAGIRLEGSAPWPT
jgi:hypothetical protein